MLPSMDKFRSIRRFLLNTAQSTLMALVTISATSIAFASNGDSHDGLRQKEYEALKDEVISFHSYSLFDNGKPYLFTGDDLKNYSMDFTRNQCVVKRLSEKECERRFQKAVLTELAQTYFAADLSLIERKCQTEPLICLDIEALEQLFRGLHNANVTQSKLEKLARIEDWRSGKISDQQLKESLHIDFHFENGQMSVSLPHRAGEAAADGS